MLVLTIQNIILYSSQDYGNLSSESITWMQVTTNKNKEFGETDQSQASKLIILDLDAKIEE